MLKTNFYIKADKAKANGECPIYAKVNFNKKTITLSTGRSITPKRWRFTDNLRRCVQLRNEKAIKEYLVNSLLGKMTVHYNITTRDFIEENGDFIDGSVVLFDSLPHKLDAVLHLTNEDGVNSISLNFNYPNYPNEGFVSCELESYITCSNETFNFIFGFDEFIFINENKALLKGTLAVNLIDSEDVDNFRYELMIQQDNCQEIILNSTITPICRSFDDEEE